MNRKLLGRFGRSLGAHAVLIVFVVISLFPVFLMVITSLKSQTELIRSPFALPQAWKWLNYYLVIVERGSYHAAVNSMIIGSATTAIVLLLSVLAAHALNLFEFRGKNVIFSAVLLALTVSEVSILIPVYQMLQTWGLLNTLTGLVLVQVALGLPFGIFFLTTFFRQVPKELVDAGRLDGCSDLQLLTNVILPVCKPAIRALAVVQFMWAWNSLLFPLVIETRQDLMPLSVSVIEFMGRFSLNYELVATTCVVMFLPILVLYLLTQKSFQRGVTMGAVK